MCTFNNIPCFICGKTVAAEENCDYGRATRYLCESNPPQNTDCGEYQISNAVKALCANSNGKSFWLT